MVGSGQFLVVEGNSGVGKSTIAASLAARLDAALHHFPPEFERFRQRADLDRRVQPSARLLYYLAATLHLSDVVREELAGRSVVCDRYLPGPLSLMAALGQMEEAAVEDVAGPYRRGLSRPDFTLMVVSDHAAACRRIRERIPARALTPVHRWTIDSSAFFAARERALRSECARLGPMGELDTTELSKDEACDRAWELVGPALERATA